MSKYTWRVGGALTLALCMGLGACSRDNKGADTTALGKDSSLNRDLSLAGRDTTVQPQLKDVPNASSSAPAAPTTRTRTAPARTTPRTSPPPRTVPPPARTTPGGNTGTTTSPGTVAGSGAGGGGAVGMIPAGSTLNLRSNSRICTNTSAVGDHVTATVNETVSGSNGAVIPAGSTVNLTVTRLHRSENMNDPVVLEFAVNSVTIGGRTYPVEATIQSASVQRVRDEPKSKDEQKVIGGAIAGAIAGRVLGKSTKATVIGGAAGAAAGAAAAAATANYNGCIDSGGQIVVKLTNGVQVRV